MERTGYSEHEVETALGLVAESGNPPTEIKCGEDVQFRAAWVLAQEVNLLRAEREDVVVRRFSSRDGHEHITAPLWAAIEMFEGLEATLARVEGALEAMRDMRQYAPDKSTGAAVDICARFLQMALKPCASSEPDTAPISTPDGHSAEPVVLENPAKQRERLL